MAHLLQTTIAGSLPKPSWLSPPKELWAPWLLEGDALAEGKRDAVRLVLRDQERAGIDIVTDGEQTRRHFVTTFIEALDGVDFANKRTVRIRNRYDADVPVVAGAVSRRAPVFVDEQYTVTHEVVGVGQSRRVESYWTRSQVAAQDGSPVATVLLHQGVVKASYAGYPEDRL